MRLSCPPPTPPKLWRGITPSYKLTKMALNTLSLTEFKQAIGTDSLSILLNDKSGKFFAVSDSGKCYKVHQTTDWSKQKPANTRVLVENGDLAEACIIPMGLGAKTIASF